MTISLPVKPGPLSRLMKKSHIIIILLLLALIACFFIFEPGQYLNLQYLKQQQGLLDTFYRANPFVTAAAYFIIYVLVAGLSVPGAAVLTLAGGAIFGLLTGTVLVSFASTIGASIAFLIARYLLRDTVQRRFGNRLATINKGIEEEGAFYLLALRLVPMVPFFVINLLMGLTTMRLPVFFVVSQVGMLAATLVYVNAGTQLAGIENAADILSVELIASFALLGIFPLLAKRLVTWLRKNPHESI
ncbi:MAG: TVP38/TMEM64 family protein [Gammaproteobacteria bacterium]